uniref:Uncharacterized protein n=1 Tax=Plectus sambesii TaxID=2011161 RepID=A0A914V1L7_9BILA
SSFEPIEPPPAAPPSKSRSPPKRVPPPQKSGQGTVKVPPAEDIAADVREIQKAVSPPTASVVKSKPPPKPSRKTTKAPTVDSHFAEEISADMFHQLNRPNEEEPDFSQFQEPEDADAPTSSKPRARRQSRLSEGEPDAKRRRTGQETVKAETIDKKAPARRTKKTPTEDQQAAMYLSVANAALANEMDE